MAAPMPTSVRLWFCLEGAATSVIVSFDAIVDDLRDAIYAKVKAKLEPRGVIASDLVLSADGKTYDDPRALVSTLPLDKEFIVTGTFVRAARLSVRGGSWVLAVPPAALERPVPFGPGRHCCVRVRCACTWRCAVLLVLVALPCES